MQLFLDESGNFVPGASQPEAWSVVAAYVTPEAAVRPAGKALKRLKRRLGRGVDDEIKLRDVSDERRYLEFLHELAALDGVVFACAVDAHRNRLEAITHHRARQSEALLENLPRVIDPEARAELHARAERFSRLSPQLYMQVMCQFQLLAAILHRGVSYFAQRVPATLGRFGWRVDRKNESNSIFDASFRDHAAPILQTISFSEPFIMLEGADYRFFHRFRFADGPPAYLKDTYGLEVGSGFSVARVLHEDFEFVDSAKDLGVQISDLVASGLRRCLRGNFTHNIVVAEALGRLMVQAPDGAPPIELLTLDQAKALDRRAPADSAVRAMTRTCRAMIVKNR